jgi:hypothetical protein
MGAQLFRTDGADRTNLKVVFCSFANAPKIPLVVTDGIFLNFSLLY